MTPSSVSAVTSKTVGKPFADGVERVIAADLQVLGQALEHAATPLCLDERVLAVHRVVEHAEFAAERFDDALQAKAYAEDRDAASGGMAHQIGNTEIRRAARAGTDQDEVGFDVRRSGATGILRGT